MSFLKPWVFFLAVSSSSHVYSNSYKMSPFSRITGSAWVETQWERSINVCILVTLCLLCHYFAITLINNILIKRHTWFWVPACCELKNIDTQNTKKSARELSCDPTHHSASEEKSIPSNKIVLKKTTTKVFYPVSANQGLPRPLYTSPVISVYKVILCRTHACIPEIS